MYVNDVLSLLENESEMYLYTDDMFILSNNVNVENMLSNLQDKIDIIHQWCNLNKMTVNEVKTKCIIIGNGNQNPYKRYA